MTWRAIWTPPGTPFPEHSDHETEAEAHGFALRKSRETGGEVAVIAIPAPESPAEPVLGASESEGRGARVPGAESEGER